MPKIYLQQKINPIPDKYLVIGPQGNVIAGDLPESVFPVIHITFPEGTTNLNAHCYSFTADVEIKSSTSADCTVKQFGTWIISGFYNGNLISDSILVSEITQYYMQLRYISNLNPTVYDLLRGIPAPNVLKENDILNCDYSGNYLIVTLPKGTYKLECWGASGGNSWATSIGSGSYYPGGRGGYSSGNIILNNESFLYLYCGQVGHDALANSAQWIYSPGTSVLTFNGGGTIYNQLNNTTSQSTSGGGATDIRLSANLNDRLIVAGAGGGAVAYYISTQGSPPYPFYSAVGGFGGGDIGGNGEPGPNQWQWYVDRTPKTATAANQLSGGTGYNGGNGFLGAGGNQANFESTSYIPATDRVAVCGSGGGGYYGGGCGYLASGAGGSSYLSSILDNAMTIAGDSAIIEPNGSEATGHTGNGYIRITVLSLVGD